MFRYASILIQELHLHLEMDTLLEVYDVVQDIMNALVFDDQDARTLLSVDDNPAIATSNMLIENSIPPEADFGSEELFPPTPVTEIDLYDDKEAIQSVVSCPPSTLSNLISKSEYAVPFFNEADLKVLGASPVFYQASSASKPAFFASLELSPIKLVISFRSTVTRTSAMSSRSAMLRELFAVDLDKVDILLNALILENVLEDTAGLLSKVIQHYKQNIISQAPKVVGSVGALGNPTVLLSSIGAGVKDFFYGTFHFFVQYFSNFCCYS
jgi:hypothetical protein